MDQEQEAQGAEETGAIDLGTAQFQERDDSELSAIPEALLGKLEAASTPERSGIYTDAFIDLKGRIESFSTTLSEQLGLKQTIQELKTDDSQQLLDLVGKSVSELAQFIHLIKQANEIARVDGERSAEMGSDLVDISIANIAKRKTAKEQPFPSPAEERVLKVYASWNKNALHLPAWFKSLQHAVEIGGQSKELPGPDNYLLKSELGEEPTVGLRTRLRALNGDILAITELGEIEERNRAAKEAAEEEGGELSENEIIDTAEGLGKDEIVAQLDRVLYEVADVDPKEVPGVADKCTFQLLPRPGFVRGLLDLRRGLSDSILALLDTPTDREEMTLYEFKGKQKDDHKTISALEEAKVSIAALTVADPDASRLASLIDLFAQTHSALMDAYAIISSSYLKPKSEHVNLKTELERRLATLFDADATVTRNALLSLSNREEEKVQDALSELVTLDCIHRETNGHCMPRSFLRDAENLQLLGLAVDQIVRGSAEQAQRITDDMAGGELSAGFEMATKVRALCEARDFLGLAKFFEKEIEKISDSKASSQPAMIALLQSLMSVSEDDGICRCLKGKLSNLEKVNTIAEQLSKKIISSKSPHVKYVETLRARVGRRFAFDLDDYLGQRELKETWEGLLKRHFKFLEHPEQWKLVASHQLFLNGYLLIGNPGVGKGFLVECMANRFELPLITVTRDEMSGQIERDQDGKASEEQLESTLSDFLQRKIDEGRKQQEKTGAKACFLFIDEMEAEFRRRLGENTTRSEIASTNIMLRVIERLMKQNPTVIFVGATNYFQLVEPAAVRWGRFGVHFHIKEPKSEDIIDIVQGTAHQMGFPVDRELLQKDYGQELEKIFTGLIPISIQLVFNSVVVDQRIDHPDAKEQFDENFLEKLREMASLIKKLRFSEEPSSVKDFQVPASES